MILQTGVCKACGLELYQTLKEITCLGCQAEYLVVTKTDFEGIVAKSNRIDLILDNYKTKIPLGVWEIMNDLNSERCDVFQKYVFNWEDLS